MYLIFYRFKKEMSSQTPRMILTVILIAKFLCIGLKSRFMENETDNEVRCRKLFDKNIISGLQIAHSIQYIFFSDIYDHADFGRLLHEMHYRFGLFLFTRMEKSFCLARFRTSNWSIYIILVSVIFLALQFIHLCRELLYD